MQVNQQPAEKRSIGDGETLDVHSVWKTIQGEGPFAGFPAVFVRLAGCNLQCPMCDTDYTSGRTKWDKNELVDHIGDMIGNATLVVITGGEPFRQNITPFVKRLLARAFYVQVETNGTYNPGPYWPQNAQLRVVCSPKTPSINNDFAFYVATDWKYVLQAGQVDEGDGLPSTALGGMYPARPPVMTPKSSIFVQPLDEEDPGKNQDNTEATLASCLKFNYRLCLQVHKIVGLP